MAQCRPLCPLLIFSYKRDILKLRNLRVHGGKDA